MIINNQKIKWLSEKIAFLIYCTFKYSTDEYIWHVKSFHPHHQAALAFQLSCPLPVLLLCLVDHRYLKSSMFTTFTGSLLHPSLSHTWNLSFFYWLSFLFSLVHISTSKQSIPTAPCSHYRPKCHLRTSKSRETPAWHHLSTCPLPLQTRMRLRADPWWITPLPLIHLSLLSHLTSDCLVVLIQVLHQPNIL